MKKVLILGANGFIGSKLSKELSKRKDLEITLFSKSTDNVDELRDCQHITVVKGDYRDILLLTTVVRDQDIVYHCISASVPSSSWVRPEEEIDKNILPTIHLLKLCAEFNIKKVVYLSSGGTVYGEQDGKLSEDSRTEPFSPYGISKVFIENILRYFYKRYGINYEVFRLSNPYGFGQDKIGFGVINTWLKSAMDNRIIKIFGDGENRKDFIYIDDVIHILKSSVDQRENTNTVLNVSSGVQVSLIEILNVIQEVSDSNIKVEYVQNSASDNREINLDNSELKRIFPSIKFTSLKTGISLLWKDLNEESNNSK